MVAVTADRAVQQACTCAASSSARRGTNACHTCSSSKPKYHDASPRPAVAPMPATTHAVAHHQSFVSSRYILKMTHQIAPATGILSWMNWSRMVALLTGLFSRPAPAVPPPLPAAALAPAPHMQQLKHKITIMLLLCQKRHQHIAQLCSISQPVLLSLWTHNLRRPNPGTGDMV